MTNQEAVATVISRVGRSKQENFFYVDAACEAMILFRGKVRFMLAYILSLAVITANNSGVVIMEKLKWKLRCRKADQQQQRNAEAI